MSTQREAAFQTIHDQIGVARRLGLIGDHSVARHLAATLTAAGRLTVEPRIWRTGDTIPDAVHCLLDTDHRVWQRQPHRTTWACAATDWFGLPTADVLDEYGPVAEVPLPEAPPKESHMNRDRMSTASGAPAVAVDEARV